MGTPHLALNAIRAELHNQDRSYAWLARETERPYKGILAEIKHGTRPATFETVLAAANALNVDLVAVLEQGVAEASQHRAVAA